MSGSLAGYDSQFPGGKGNFPMKSQTHPLYILKNFILSIELKSNDCIVCSAPYLCNHHSHNNIT